MIIKFAERLCLMLKNKHKQRCNHENEHTKLHHFEQIFYKAKAEYMDTMVRFVDGFKFNNDVLNLNDMYVDKSMNIIEQFVIGTKNYLDNLTKKNRKSIQS